MSVAFVVYGKAEPGGSKRWLPAGGRSGGRPIIVDANRRTKDWQRAVAYAAGAVMNGQALLDRPVRLTLRFYVTRPAGHFTTTGALSAHGRRHPFPDVRPDLTKLTRAVEDALTGIVLRDDARVVQQDVAKLWGEPARLEVEVEPALPFEDGRTSLP